MVMCDSDVLESHDDSTLKALGARLREARTRVGMTAEDVEKRSGVKVGTLSRYERGVAEPGAVKLTILAKTYGVSCDWLLGRTDSPNQTVDAQALIDLDKVEAVQNAKTENDIEKHLLWRPPPLLAVVALPPRRKLVDLQEAIDTGSRLLHQIKSVAPESYQRWRALHILGE